MTSLSTIVVDLTPLSPGGDNGGAKIFSVELVRRLAASRPSVQFVLLTQRASHEELAALDAVNVRRHLAVVDGDPGSGARRPRLARVRALAGKLPRRVRSGLGRLRLRASSWVERRRRRGLLRELEADLLFCPFTSPRFAEPGVPTVCVVHDLQYRTYPQFFDPDDALYRDATFMSAVRRASVLVAVSDYTRESVLRQARVDPARVRVVPHRIAKRIGFERPADPQVLRELGLLPGRYLLYPANFWRHKNHEMLLVAFGLGCRDGLPVDAVLVCTGAPGDRQRYLAGATRSMGIGDRVRFPGHVSNEAFATLLGNAGGLVFPSLYEGFGMPVVEAMVAGVPVACSNTTALPEVVNGAAILFDPRKPDQMSQAMIRLLQDVELRARLVEAGRHHAARYTDVERMMDEYWTVFEQSVAGA